MAPRARSSSAMPTEKEHSISTTASSKSWLQPAESARTRILVPVSSRTASGS
jgi:hypothetical protein